MSVQQRVEQYRKRAEECVALAAQPNIGPELQKTLREVAEKWRNLAQFAERGGDQATPTNV